jgi:hypothetical protein
MAVSYTNCPQVPDDEEVSPCPELHEAQRKADKMSAELDKEKARIQELILIEAGLADDKTQLQKDIKALEEAKQKWIGRFVSIGKKLAMVLGMNNTERSWVREAGFDCPDEEN